MEITSEIRNDLFKRNEIMAELEAEKNPGFDEVRKMISEQTKKSEDSIDVYGIKGSFGSNSFVIKANVYDSKEDKDNAEQLTQKQRKVNKEEAAKQKEEAAKPEEEARPEEVKPEAIAEETPKPADADVEALAEEKPTETPVEAPVEEKPEEQAKAVNEEKEMAEESKE